MKEMELRPSVQRFAEEMEKRLRMHDGEKGQDGWEKEDPRWLIGRLCEEVNELIESSKSADQHREAIDVGNFAMMVADVTRGEPSNANVQATT